MAHARADIGQVDYATDIATGHHKLVADEGPELGGKDAGPAPYDLLTSALGACTVITLRMYAERKQWPVTAVHADIHFVRQDKVESIDRTLRIEGNVDDEQKKRMAEIAERTPVTLTLKRSMEIRTTLARGDNHEDRFQRAYRRPSVGVRSSRPPVRRRGGDGLRLRHLQRPRRHPDRDLLALPLQRDRRVHQPGHRRAQRAADRIGLRRRAQRPSSGS